MKTIGIIKIIFIVILSIIVIVLGVWLERIYYYEPKTIVVTQDCVPDCESAIRIAQVVYKAYCGVEYDANDFKYSEEDTHWQVYLKTYNDQEESFAAADAGVYINKHDGTIERVVIAQQ